MSHISRNETVSWLKNHTVEELKMKNNLIKHIGRAFALTLLTIVAAGAGFAQESKGGGRLVGTWDSAVTIRDCATGDAMASFLSIASFNEGGTTIGSTAGIPQAARTPEHGVWRHLSGNRYLFKFKSFSFDIAGNASGYSVVTHTIILDRSGDTYTSSGVARFYLMNGAQVGQGCSDAIGTRFDL
jgi:hypothetical protein